MAPMKLLLITVTLALTILHTCDAWFCDGHMIVSDVASRYTNPTATQRIQPLIAELANQYPKSRDIRGAACWPDDLKEMGDYMESPWHYINLPYIRSAFFNGIKQISNHSNVAWAIQQTTSILKSNTTDIIAKARSIRFLIHFVGDIHQPLHAATLYARQFPNGDEGGNKYLIRGDSNYTELHALWDSGVKLWGEELTRPLTPAGVSTVEAWGTDVVSRYPPSSFPAKLLDETDPYQWGSESLAVDVSFVYTQPFNQTVSQTYIQKGQSICRQQVALGGYRLASLLNSIFS